MRRWIPVFLVGLIMVSTAGACDPPPPAGWVPPKILSADVSSSEVVAGTPFTVSVAATDDHHVNRIELRFLTARAVDPLRVPCSADEWTPGPAVNVDFTCTMPLIAANGGWDLTVLAYDGEWSGPHGACGCDARTIQLNVTGGSDDHLPPVQESAVVSPDPVPVGAPLVATVRMSDDHLDDYTDPVSLVYDVAGKAKYCQQTASTRVSPTVHEWVFNCPPSEKAGSFLAIGYMRDAMGYLGEMRFMIDVVDAA